MNCRGATTSLEGKQWGAAFAVQFVRRALVPNGRYNQRYKLPISTTIQTTEIYRISTVSKNLAFLSRCLDP